MPSPGAGSDSECEYSQSQPTLREPPRFRRPTWARYTPYYAEARAQARNAGGYYSS
jgi:hypothetical protein